ncbi:transcriptional regulator [Desulfosporosinus orientis DSM 765]|uniref:Transcriptional regulator n=1 Tax=Desulfosporosinus orientis (strain ATCC 19365 / DSM 765 / NCIMB 8382 / VKM B-1628 / Singapore I) TaxID=768706 RepID=G7WIR1_DESOD|nr:MarR family transcriptional regulator [Desulfosporosinus orientis]AET69135.1 transcriptional regulator [Desulfosporosinus orientis DSM 765]
MNRLDKEKFIFGSLFLLANKMQVNGDKYLAEDDMTLRQWFLTISILQFGDHPPTLNEVAEKMGSTRQNVKQLVTKLLEKGFITVEKDAADARAMRLKLTDKSESFWEGREEKDRRFITDLFKDLTNSELNVMCEGLNKLLDTIKGMNRNA